MLLGSHRDAWRVCSAGLSIYISGILSANPPTIYYADGQYLELLCPVGCSAQSQVFLADSCGEDLLLALLNAITQSAKLRRIVTSSAFLTLCV